MPKPWRRVRGHPWRIFADALIHARRRCQVVRHDAEPSVVATAWPADKENAVLEPYTYLDANPGKEVRTKLIEAFNVWLKVPARKLDAICSVVRMLHTASLLMDDVEDNSDLRRGIPVAHKIYGVPQTINTATTSTFSCSARSFA